MRHLIFSTNLGILREDRWLRQVVALIYLTRYSKSHSSIAMGVKLTCLLSFVLQGLDNVSSATLRPFNSDINTPRIDSYRFSMANLEGKLAYHSPRSRGLSTPLFIQKSHPRSVGDFHACQTRGDASDREA